MHRCSDAKNTVLTTLSWCCSLQKKKPTKTGYEDFTAIIDLSTYRAIPWEEQMPFFLIDFHHPRTGEPMMVSPRSLLKNVLGRLADAGYEALAGVEFEFFCFKGGYFLPLSVSMRKKKE
jgi:glutamine synthetase